MGPYSLFYVAGDFVFVSGLLGVDPVTGNIPTDTKEEMRMILRNLSRVILPLGLSPADVVKATIFATRFDDFGEINKIWEEFFLKFSDVLPARSSVGVSFLPCGATFEVDFILFLSDPSKLALAGKYFFLKRDFLKAHEFFERAWARSKSDVFRALALLSAIFIKIGEGRKPSSLMKKFAQYIPSSYKKSLAKLIKEFEVSGGEKKLFDIARNIIEILLSQQIGISERLR